MAEEYSPDNGVGERGSERTEIKCSLKPVTMDQARWLWLIQFLENVYIIMNRIFYLSFKKNIMYFEVFVAMAALLFSLFSEDLLHSQRSRQIMDRHSS